VHFVQEQERYKEIIMGVQHLNTKGMGQQSSNTPGPKSDQGMFYNAPAGHKTPDPSNQRGGSGSVGSDVTGYPNGNGGTTGRRSAGAVIPKSM
jgi:hypothetical protein